MGFDRLRSAGGHDMGTLGDLLDKASLGLGTHGKGRGYVVGHGRTGSDTISVDPAEVSTVDLLNGVVYPDEPGVDVNVLSSDVQAQVMDVSVDSGLKATDVFDESSPDCPLSLHIVDELRACKTEAEVNHLLKKYSLVKSTRSFWVFIKNFIRNFTLKDKEAVDVGLTAYLTRVRSKSAYVVLEDLAPFGDLFIFRPQAVEGYEESREYCMQRRRDDEVGEANAQRLRRLAGE